MSQGNTIMAADKTSLVDRAARAYRLAARCVDCVEHEDNPCCYKYDPLDKSALLALINVVIADCQQRHRSSCDRTEDFKCPMNA